jgi:hypothetical protein
MTEVILHQEGSHIAGSRSWTVKLFEFKFDLNCSKFWFYFPLLDVNSASETDRVIDEITDEVVEGEPNPSDFMLFHNGHYFTVVFPGISFISILIYVSLEIIALMQQVTIASEMH